MLHTVTNDFLLDKYPTTRDKNSKGPIKSNQRFNIDPAEFRAKLAKKIYELHKKEISEEQILKEL